eukprot:CAMPEP_0179022372 /NCGR_PEP_ID=MMETSP0796-20121207/6373_1 /TAXON_ID=73915 /ORGANISM="Pyrodinium bahamense, Strain pbaha01" /LENGTH=160 /DNA_ID=CAMNT_0020718235 /DNA_START=293 /DNA_END=775 /DNA_ORIENTATION=+
MAAASTSSLEDIEVSREFADAGALTAGQGRPARLLLARKARRLQSSNAPSWKWLQVTYEVRTASVDLAEQLVASVSDPSGDFKQRFVESLQLANPWLQVADVILEQPWTVYRYILMQHPSPEPEQEATNAGLIVGVVLGSLVGIALACAVVIGCAKRKYT